MSRHCACQKFIFMAIPKINTNLNYGHKPEPESFGKMLDYATNFELCIR